MTGLVAAVFSLAVAGVAAATDRPAPVVQGLEKTFNVTADQISSLQAQGLGYGEIGIIFAIASNMTGGINDTNIAAIMGDRQGTPPMGWGQIAMSLTGMSLGKIVSPLASANGSSNSAGAGSQGGIASAGHMSSQGAAGYGGRGGR